MAAEADVPWWTLCALGVATLGLALLLCSSVARRRADERARNALHKKLDDEPVREEEDVLGGSPQDIKKALEQEAWAPKMEVREWQDAAELPGCPWHFECCQSLSEVLDRVWRRPLCPELQQAFDALAPRVKSVQVSRVEATLPTATHFSLIYTLHTGAELFGGAPLEHAVGLDMGDVGELKSDGGASSRSGLRRRRGSATSQPSTVAENSEATEILLPCLMPFYRIHDGFGVLLSTRHLPLLLSSPTEGLHGSCYYVYPARALDLVDLRRPLVRFARVDKSCSACAETGLEQPAVVYLETNGLQTEDDEAPIAFVGDTISNVAGQRVVPPPYLGGPAPY